MLRQVGNSWTVQLGKWWEQEAAQSPPCLDSCLPRLRSRTFGYSRGWRWTWSSMLRKTQHEKCILRATSDGWQACVHGIRSRRRAVTDKRVRRKAEFFFFLRWQPPVFFLSRHRSCRDGRGKKATGKDNGWSHGPGKRRDEDIFQRLTAKKENRGSRPPSLVSRTRRKKTK